MRESRPPASSHTEGQYWTWFSGEANALSQGARIHPRKHDVDQARSQVPDMQQRVLSHWPPSTKSGHRIGDHEPGERHGPARLDDHHHRGGSMSSDHTPDQPTPAGSATETLTVTFTCEPGRATPELALECGQRVMDLLNAIADDL